MAKEKAKKGVPNKHLHARIAYLHQAATYLTTQAPVQSQNDAQQASTNGHQKPEERMIELPPGTLAMNATNIVANAKPSPGHPSTATFNPPASGLPLQLNAHLRSVAQKGQIRLSSDLKIAICKVCSSPLIEGETCLKSVENLSKGGRKPWANVLVVKCCACGACKRFPVGAKKQKRKSVREADQQDENGADASGVEDQVGNMHALPGDGAIAESHTELQMRPAGS
jgi:ribonuclease P protein subunit RPR2